MLSYYSFHLNPNSDKHVRMKFLLDFKKKLINSDKYDTILNKAIVGLFNNSKFDVSNTDLIIVPSSTSNLNIDIANKIISKTTFTEISCFTIFRKV